MKQWIIYSLLLFFTTTAYCQQEKPQRFLRIAADNDAFVPTRTATDWGYTSGIMIDVFHSSVNLLGIFQGINNFSHNDRFNTSGWGLMQMIYAPQKTSLAIPDQNDYPYSGALLIIHSFHSSYQKKKLNVLSQCIAGVMGPPSLGKETHTFFHRLIKDPKPMGWDHQLPTDLLFNYNIRAEKLLAGNKNIALLGSGEIRCGTMNDGLSPALRLQWGNTNNYFRGSAKQYFSDKKPKLSLSVQTSADIVFYNALLQGGLFNKRSPVHDKGSKLGTTRNLQHLAGSLECSVLFSLKKFSVSFEQKFTTSELKGHGSHSIGNIAIYKIL